MSNRNHNSPGINQETRQQVFEAIRDNPLGTVEEIAAECGISQYQLRKLARTCPEITEVYGAGLVAKLNRAIDTLDRTILQSGDLRRANSLARVARLASTVNFYRGCVENWQTKHGMLLQGIKERDAKALAKLQRISMATKSS